MLAEKIAWVLMGLFVIALVVFLSYSGQEKELYSKAYIGGLDSNSDVAWQKPVRLVEKYIRLYSEPDTIVLDRFAGTGTTLVAAHRQGRTSRLAELLPRMADVILRRAESEGLTVERADA